MEGPLKLHLQSLYAGFQVNLIKKIIIADLENDLEEQAACYRLEISLSPDPSGF